MSLESLEIRAALKPVQAELDRQKEKCAAMKKERDDARAELATQEALNAATLEQLATAKEEATAHAKRVEEATRSMEFHLDWYKTRFERLRKWVSEEVQPLSVRDRFFAIMANGTAAPHERPAYVETLHALRVDVGLLTKRVEELEAERAPAPEATLARMREGVQRIAGLEAEVTRLRAEAATVAERQRKACAHHCLSPNDKTASEWFAARVLLTPLVTPPEGKAAVENCEFRIPPNSVAECIAEIRGNATDRELIDRLVEIQGYLRHGVDQYGRKP